MPISTRALVCSSLLLAACGGGATGTTPAPSPASALTPSTLVMGYVESPLFAVVPVDSSRAGTVFASPNRPWPGLGNAFPGAVDAAIAPDGSIYLIEKSDFFFGGERRIVVIGPSHDGRNTEYYTRGGAAGIGLGRDGLMVAEGFVVGDQPNLVIETYPYERGRVSPVHALAMPPGDVQFVLGPDGLVYLARADGYDVFAQDSDGCCPLRTVRNGTSMIGMRIGPGGEAYVLRWVNTARGVANAIVSVYGTSGALARELGPIVVRYDPMYTAPQMTVDRQGRVYVEDAGGTAVYGAGASGTAAPLFVLGNPGQHTVLWIAVGP